MKTTNFLRGALAMVALAISGGLMAQGHHHGNGNGHGHGRGGRDDHRKQQDHQYSYHRDRDDRNHHHHGSYGHRSPERVVYVYHPAPVERRVVHHYHRPVRYVYYRDYDVYFDCQRNVFISYSGSHWTISTAVPVRMVNVDRTRISSSEMDYYDDDFPSYMDRLRPKGEAYKDWAW